MSTRIVQGDSLKAVRFRLWTKDSSGLFVALDLTDCTGEVKYSIAGGTTKVKTLTMLSPRTAGIVELPANATNWDASGLAEGRVYITSGLGIGKTFRFHIEVEPEFTREFPAPIP